MKYHMVALKTNKYFTMKICKLDFTKCDSFDNKAIHFTVMNFYLYEGCSSFLHNKLQLK